MISENLIYTLIFFVLLYGLTQLNKYLENKVFFPSSFLTLEEGNIKEFLEELMEYGQIAVYVKVFKKYAILDKTFALFFKEFNILFVHLNNEYFTGITPNLDFIIVKTIPVDKTLEELENNYTLYISKYKNFIYIFAHNEKNQPVMELLYNSDKKKMFKIETKTALKGKKLEYFQKLGKLNKIRNFKQLLNAYDIEIEE